MQINEFSLSCWVLHQLLPSSFSHLLLLLLLKHFHFWSLSLSLCLSICLHRWLDVLKINICLGTLNLSSYVKLGEMMIFESNGRMHMPCCVCCYDYWVRHHRHYSLSLSLSHTSSSSSSTLQFLHFTMIETSLK